MNEQYKTFGEEIHVFLNKYSLPKTLSLIAHLDRWNVFGKKVDSDKLVIDLDKGNLSLHNDIFDFYERGVNGGKKRLINKRIKYKVCGNCNVCNLKKSCNFDIIDKCFIESKTINHDLKSELFYLIKNNNLSVDKNHLEFILSNLNDFDYFIDNCRENESGFENLNYCIDRFVCILLRIITSKENDILFLFSPENFLHPKEQVLIGKMIGIAAVNNRQLIVETNSSYIINESRIMIAKNLIDNKKVSINFFKYGCGDSDLYHQYITINNQAMFSKVPVGLFDDHSDQIMRLKGALE